jgi:hypothetical protein
MVHSRKEHPMPIHEDDEFGPSCQDDYEFETKTGIYSPVIDQLKEKVEHFDITAEVEGPEKKPLYLQLEYRVRLDHEESYYCLWTQNPEAVGNMEHDDCQITRGESFDELYVILANRNSIKLDLIPIDKWEEVQTSPR